MNSWGQNSHRPMRFSLSALILATNDSLPGGALWLHGHTTSLGGVIPSLPLFRVMELPPLPGDCIVVLGDHWQRKWCSAALARSSAHCTDLSGMSPIP
ncbi:hypothetical protein BC826DRAFT_1053161, partial [Russula brevipes]